MLSVAITYRDSIETALKGINDKCTLRVEEDNTVPIVDPDFNETINGIVNIFNVNSTHFSLPTADTLLWKDSFRNTTEHTLIQAIKLFAICSELWEWTSPSSAPTEFHSPPRRKRHKSSSFGAFCDSPHPWNFTNTTNTSSIGCGVGGAEGPSGGGGFGGPPGGDGGGPEGSGQIGPGGIEEAVDNALGTLGDLYSLERQMLSTVRMGPIHWVWTIFVRRLLQKMPNQSKRCERYSGMLEFRTCHRNGGDLIGPATRHYSVLCRKNRCAYVGA